MAVRCVDSTEFYRERPRSGPLVRQYNSLPQPPTPPPLYLSIKSARHRTINAASPHVELDLQRRVHLIEARALEPLEPLGVLRRELDADRGQLGQRLVLLERVGQLLKSGELKDIVCIPTSVRTKEQAEELGIPLTTLGTPESRYSKLDVAIDGADAVDPQLNLIKGGGGALFREQEEDWEDGGGEGRGRAVDVRQNASRSRAEVMIGDAQVILPGY